MSLFQKSPIRISIDLGSRYTRVLKTPEEEDAPLCIPTVFAQKEDAFLLGNHALQERDNAKLINPLDHGILLSEKDCLSYLQMLHQKIKKNNRATWAVVSAPSIGKFKDSRKLVEIASQVFYNVLVVPELTMAVFSLRNNHYLSNRKATVINLGASCLQLALVEGTWPEPKEIIHLSGGGNEIDQVLKEAIESLLPDISISLETARKLKERFSQAASYDSPVCPVELSSGHQKKIVDIGRAITRAITPVGTTISNAAQYLFNTNKIGKNDPHVKKIVLTGGGAGIPGLGEELKTHLQQQGYHTDEVVVPADHCTTTVRGGMDIARLLKPEHWKSLA